MPRPPDRLYVAVKAAVWKRDRLLLVREGAPEAGHYDLPGGRLDAGESLESGLRRELREELGVEIKEWSGLPIKTWATVSRDGTGVVALLYRVTLASEEFTHAPGDEVTAAQWLTLEELLRAQGAIHKPFVLEYFREALANP